MAFVRYCEKATFKSSYKSTTQISCVCKKPKPCKTKQNSTYLSTKNIGTALSAKGILEQQYLAKPNRYRY